MLSLRISEIRNKNNLSQADLAKYLKISQQTYSSYETGRRQMSYETLCLLADYHKVSTDYLLGRQETSTSNLNEDERTVIEQYRALDEHTKGSIKNSLAFEYSRTHKAKARKKAT